MRDSAHFPRFLEIALHSPEIFIVNNRLFHLFRKKVFSIVVLTKLGLYFPNFKS